MGESSEPASASTGAIKLSRYVLLTRIAAGGAGVVYSAYDPELDRRVAVKLLLPLETAKGDDTAAAVRLMREAQAAARLSHPNVVAVYDVGTYDLGDGELAALTHDLEREEGDEHRTPQRRGVFVVMEFVEGSTLRDWTRSGHRSWREVLRVFLSAGEGLAAAHAKDLIHRDFKPGNVIVGTDGRARVLDFGLARLVGNRPDLEETSPRREPSSDRTIVDDGGEEAPPPVMDEEATVQYASNALQVPSGDGYAEVKIIESRLTRTGTVMGTPAYMSPEQHQADKADETSDQFSFCVAMYEALYGDRPFSGDTLEALGEAKAAGKFAAPSDRGGVPLHVRRALTRGLSPEPSDRFTSMRALLDELARDPGRRRRQLLALGGLGLVAVAAVTGYRMREQTQQALCAEHDGTFDEVWGEAAHAQVQSAFADVGRAYATDALAAIEPALDEYTSRWTTLRRDVCLGSVASDELPPEVARRRVICLDRRRRAVEELIGLFREADEGVASHAIEAIDSLPGLDACTDDEALVAGALPPATAEQERVLDIEARIARSDALLAAGKYQEAFDITQAVSEQLDGLNHAPTRAGVLLAMCDAQSSLADYEAAAKTCHEAWKVAAGAGAEDAETEAILRLIILTGYRQARADEGHRLAELAQARLQNRSIEEQEGRLAYALGMLGYAGGEHAQTEEWLQRAIDFYTERYGPDHIAITRVYNLLGAARLKAGKLDEAREALEKSVELRRAKLGPMHPQVAQPLNNLALVILDEEGPAEALELFEETLKIRSSALGADHELVSASLMNIGISQMELGRYEPALENMKRSHTITEKTYGERHPITADALGNLGNVLAHLGRFDEALEMHRKALSIRVELLGPDHDAVAVGHHELGDSLLYLGELPEAIEEFEASVGVFEASLGADSYRLVTPLRGLGEAQLAAGRPELARVALERAMKLYEARGEGDSLHRARVMYALGQIVAREDPARARELGNAARDQLVGNTSKTVASKQFERWLARLPQN